MFHVKLFFLLFLALPFIGHSQDFSISTFEVKPMPALPAKIEAISKQLNEFHLFESFSNEQKEWYYWTNYSRIYPKTFWDSVVYPILKTYPSLVSEYTQSLKRDLFKASPASLLVPTVKLLNISNEHAKDLSRKQSNPSHSSTNGTTFQGRMQKNDIKGCAAENISFGPPNPVMALVLLYIDEKLPDLGHRKNLMSSDFKQMGVSIVEYKNKQVLVVQDFACDQNL